MRAAKRNRMMKIIRYGSPVVVLLAWWFGSASSSNPFFPPLSNILERFQSLWLFEHFMTDIVPSMTNLLVSYAIGVVVGITLGILIALNTTMRLVVEPLLHFVRSIPPVALIPVFIAMIGFGTDMRILAISLATLFPVVIATIDGVSAVDKTKRDVARSFNLPQAEIIKSIYLPGAAPHISAGMRVGLMIAFVIMVASEMLGSSFGIGALTLKAQQSFLMTDMWAGIILLGVLGVLLNIAFEFTEQKILPWRKKTNTT